MAVMGSPIGPNARALNDIGTPTQRAGVAHVTWWQWLLLASGLVTSMAGCGTMHTPMSESYVDQDLIARPSSVTPLDAVPGEEPRPGFRQEPSTPPQP